MGYKIMSLSHQRPFVWMKKRERAAVDSGRFGGGGFRRCYAMAHGLSPVQSLPSRCCCFILFLFGCNQCILFNEYWASKELKIRRIKAKWDAPHLDGETHATKHSHFPTTFLQCQWCTFGFSLPPAFLFGCTCRKSWAHKCRQTCAPIISRALH